MENKNSKLKQSKIANPLGYSTNTLKRFKNDIKMLSAHRIQPNTDNKRSKNVSNTKLDNYSHRDRGVKRPRVTSNYLQPTPKEHSPEVKPVKNKNKLKGGANSEINEKNL